MVYQHTTPYVTPHILHKHYAQAFDAETNTRTSVCIMSNRHLLIDCTNSRRS